MKTRMDLIRNRNLICKALYACLFLLASAVILRGQSNPASPVPVPEQKAKPERDITIRVAVDEVRIDAVVLNWKGSQITDLTADDFEIYHDGKQQEIISCAYINDSMPRGDRKISLISAPPPSRDEIRRTILFLVDDLSMDFENLHFARMALNKFVEKQMQPGDLVGILKTSIGSGLPFTSDRRQLMAAIEKIQWGAAQANTNCGPGG
jgi:VWFA-related protein